MRGRRARREHSAGGVVLRRIEGEIHVLVIRDPYDNWGLPKGHLEKDEDSRSAAMREVREETGLEELELGPELGTIDWYFRDGETLVHKYCDFYLMASATGEPVPEVGEGITEVEWVPLQEAPARVTYGNARRMVRQAVELMNGSGPDVTLESLGARETDG